MGCALLILTFAATVHADPLDQWTWRYPRPQASTLRSVTYGGGQFVAVGDFGTIITSSDAYHWTNQTYGTFPGLYGVAYAGGSYAAVGVSGTILTSSNGVNWIRATSPTTNNLRAIAGDPSASPRFIAAGDQGAAVSSMDGVTWAGWNSSSTNNLKGVAFDSANYFGVGDNGTILYGMSFDLREVFGTDWITTNNLRCIAFGNGVYASGGALGVYGSTLLNSILYSLDGFDW